MLVTDVHGHFGEHRSDLPDEFDQCMSATAAEVAGRAERAGIDRTIVSSLEAILPSGRDVAKGNDEARAAADNIPSIFFWAVLDPEGAENWKEVEELLRHPKCTGVKLHPHMHGYAFKDRGNQVLSFCRGHSAAVISHTGDASCDPLDFVALADAFPDVPIILSHLGHGPEGHVFGQVRAIESNAAGNLYTDTSSQRFLYGALLEAAVDRIAARRILFGTDTPLYFAACQKTRVEAALIGADQKRSILGENAQTLLFERTDSKRFMA